MNKFMAVLSVVVVLGVLAAAGPGEAGKRSLLGGTLCDTPGLYEKVCDSQPGYNCTENVSRCQSSTSNDTDICKASEGSPDCEHRYCVRVNRDKLETPCETHE